MIWDLVAVVVPALLGYVLGRATERVLFLRDLNRARNEARAEDQVALSEIMRVMRGRAR